MKKYLPWLVPVIVGFLFFGPLGSILGVLIYGGVKHFSNK